MPTPQFPGVSDNAGLPELKDAYISISRYLTYLLSALDTLNISRLDAKVVVTGTLDAGKVTIRADMDGGAYIQIDSAGGLVINNGTQDTFHADINGFVTLTGALIQSSSGSYPKVVMDPTDVLFGAFKDANNSLSVMSFTSGSDVPAIRFRDALSGNTAYIYYDPEVPELVITVQGNLNIGTTGGTSYINGVDTNATLTDLQTQINGKADAFSGYSGTVSTGTNTLHFSNGILTSVT